MYNRFRQLRNSLFSFTHFDSFQENISRGLPNQWHCRAGGRFLYVCEDGLVHYCSQQKGRPGIPLEEYKAADLKREGERPKGCAPFCTISCVHQTAMLDDFREKPRETLSGILDRRRKIDPDIPVPAVRPSAVLAVSGPAEAPVLRKDCGERASPKNEDGNVIGPPPKELFWW